MNAHTFPLFIAENYFLQGVLNVWIRAYWQEMWRVAAFAADL